MPRTIVAVFWKIVAVSKKCLDYCCIGVLQHAFKVLIIKYLRVSLVSSILLDMEHFLNNGL